ncbi:MAG: hypothetical protein WC379_07520 [Methanoregula sp.]|jgi:hypothetical protein
MDFRINPEDITNELYNFVTTGNGILTGHPGAGKSYEIDKLVKFLEEKGHTVLFLPIDKLIAESDIELQNELEIKSDLFEYIAAEEHVSSSKKGVVIIDAFDAARSGNKRNFYLKLIRKIIAKLSEEWNVLVVVRIFDAKKSSELLNIFSDNSKLNQKLSLKILKTSKEIPCRHVILPELNMDDLNYILVYHPIISKYSSDFNPRLKKMLLNPFYISLIIYLIQTEESSLKINSVYSEVQLLDLYWNSRIDLHQSGINYEIILNELTNKMVITHSLSVPISGLTSFQAENLVYLLSTGILANVGINKNKIAYTHNILFDYAVSRLAINDDENGLISFISTDKPNIVLLKPSIRYYLTKIWYNDKDLFKNICSRLYKAKSSEIPLIAKIMATQVLVQEADSVNDCNFIYSLYDEDTKYRDWLHATIFSSLESFERDLEFPNLPNRKFWLNYFEQVIQNTSNPHDFNIVNWLYKIQNDDKNSDVQLQIGRISRKMLSTCLELRKNNKNIDNFASHLPVSLVVKTFGSDPYQSREVLEIIFEIVNEEDFDLSYLIAVAYNIKEIFPFDQEFVSKFYTFIFSRTEDSSKQTEMGTAGYFRLTSNRRQDFEGIRYHLGQESGLLLDSDLQMGSRTLIKSINYGICRMHILPYLQEGHSIQERIESFPFNEKESKFLEDFSYIWGDSYFQMESESEMLTQIKNKINKIATNPDDKSLLKIALNEYRDYAVVSILWRDLIKTISTNPEPFSSVILDLVCAKPLQMHPETINELADLIESSIQYLSDDEINKIVMSTLKTFNEIDDVDYKKYMNERRNYLLSKIPLKYLPAGISKTEVEEYLKNNDAPPRRPIEFSETKIGFASEEDILEIKEIDSSNDNNQLILPNISIIKKFNDKWINEAISEADAQSILQQFKELYIKIEDQNTSIPKETIDYAWEELSRCAKIITKGIKNPESELFHYSLKVLLKSATIQNKIKNEDFPPDYDPLSWSPTPVTNAVGGLLILYSLQKDDEIWRTIKRLSLDEDPVVRSIIAIDLVFLLEKTPEKYWETIDAFIERENNYKIHELICHSLNVAFRKKPDCNSEVKKRLELIWRKSEKLGDKGLGLINNNCFLASVGYLAFVDEINWAKNFFDEVQKSEPYSTLRPKIVSLIINQYFTTPTIFNEKYDNARLSISRWLNQIIKSVFHEIQQEFLVRTKIIDVDIKQLENLREVIGQYITRFYFAIDKKFNKIEDPESATQAISTIYRLEVGTIELILESLLNSDERVGLRGDQMQYLMGILESCMSQDPEKVLELAVKSLKFGQRIGYSADYLGKTEIQGFIDHFLADHRDILEGKLAMNNFTDLLDNYAMGNSPEAIKYVMSLDLEYQ